MSPVNCDILFAKHIQSRADLLRTICHSILWSDVLEYLKSRDQSYTFNCTLRALDTDEDFRLEYDGPHLALESKLEVTQDKDVALKVRKEGPRTPEMISTKSGEQVESREK